jgi:hypothetical protein
VSEQCAKKAFDHNNSRARWRKSIARLMLVVRGQQRAPNSSLLSFQIYRIADYRVSAPNVRDVREVNDWV